MITYGSECTDVDVPGDFDPDVRVDVGSQSDLRTEKPQQAAPPAPRNSRAAGKEWPSEGPQDTAELFPSAPFHRLPVCFNVQHYAVFKPPIDRKPEEVRTRLAVPEHKKVS
jgi:hypothetical protein